MPLVGAVLGWVTRSDRLDWRRSLGLLVGIGGVAALVGLDLGRGDILALVQVLTVAVCYAVGPFILNRYLADLPGLGVIASALLLTAIGYAVPAAYRSRQWPPTEAIVAVVVLGVVCTAVAFLLFFQLIDAVGPTRATVVAYLNPAVAVALGIVFLDEPFTRGIMTVGFVLVLLGSALATRRSRTAAPRTHRADDSHGWRRSKNVGGPVNADMNSSPRACASGVCSLFSPARAASSEAK